MIMKKGYFSVAAETLPEKPDIHLFLVFDNDVSLIRVDLEFDPDVYYINDERLDDQKRWKNPDAFFDMFLKDISVAGKKGKRIIVVHYNPMVAQCVREFFKFFEQEKRIQWHALSFFHDDAGTKLLGLNWRDVLLQKFYEIDSMNHYPWIKKLEVEPDKSLDHRTLLQMVLDEEEFEILDNEDEVLYIRIDNDKPPQVTWKVLDKKREKLPDPDGHEPPV
jgi:hypothetical protein